MGSPRRALGGFHGRGTDTIEGAEEAESAAWASRPDRRSYLLSIRPQNSLSSSRFSPSSLGRSTFCAIISQLTEETQPLFETTIKSRSVSEDSDAKFTCIVTGYPQPEVTWYKDDEEMDRYCGLPKYQIFRHGNRHTLQLYKCQEEDAGIYQASARNNKGIVSCSGVLEVGTMTEFKIHQKWFAKIKRKAEEKLREIEQGKKRGKENVEVERLQGMSPDRLQRKRRLVRDMNLQSGASLWEKEDAAKVHVADSQSRLHKDIAEPKEQPVKAMTGFPNKLSAPLKAEVTANGDASFESVEENGNSFLTYIYETVEDLTTKPVVKDSAAKKKKKLEAPPAAKQEVSKREETGRDRANPSLNPRFAPPVPLRKNTRLRGANDQEVESSLKIKEPGKAVNQDGKINGDMHFSLKEMYFDKQVEPAAGKEEAGAKEEAVSKAALQPVAIIRQPEDAPSSSQVAEAGPVLFDRQRGRHQAQMAEGNKALGPEVAAAVGQSACDLNHPGSAPTVEAGQQANKLEELRKEIPFCQETRGSGKRTNPRLRPQEPPKPPAHSPDYLQPRKEQPASRKQTEEHSHALEGRETQPALLNQEDKSEAPQVIRKIRAEQFSDASGNLKLWCQFFNILSDSKLMWYKDEIPVAEAQKSAGDESQAALAVVQASQKDCGVYRCVISNEYGTDSTDFLLSGEVLSGFILREEIEVGEEIEMTPMVFAKGLADAGYWGDKLFGRVVSEDMEVGAGFLHKACRARAIYGLEPVFESGCTCIIKVHNFIVFGTKNENSLIEKNYDITIQECKIQNSSREYCKIFAAEARAVPDFGAVPEIIPLYLIYRPANNIPYATMEEDLGAPCEQYCVTERDGSLVARGTSEIVLKCCTFQHWVYQWTNGNILVTDMEGVGWKMTNVRIATNLKGYQGLKESCFPSLLEQFTTAHQCNHYCSILGLKTLEPAKPKGSKSPSMGRKSAQSSPQLQKKGLASPQGTRKAAVSPKSSRRAAETGETPAASKPGSGESSRSGCPQ
ncbi:alpha-protein kinase 3 isoform 6-T7 [Ara ararauna]